jgi:hypothetical protein
MTAANNPEPQKQPPAPIIPVVEVLQPRSVIPAEITQVIANVPPSEALAYIDAWVKLEYQDRDKQRIQQIERDKIAQENEKLKENNRASEKKDDRATSQKNLRWALGIFLAVFVASLGYGYVKNDSEVPKTILTLGAGLLGGTGIKEGLLKSKESRKEDDVK